MLESFVIMLREGVEAALVIGILLVVLRRDGRKDLERVAFWGLGAAVLASIAAAVLLNTFLVNKETYEGVLYWVSAAFVISMIVWMHRKGRTLRTEIERHVVRATDGKPGAREAWALGAFAFMMVFREGAETVMFLSAVQLTTDAVLSFLGVIFGLIAAIVFAVMFVRGSLQVDLGRFFTVTGWVLSIFVLQLIVNGYHEFSEAGVVPATQRTMALVGPIVRNNALFIVAMLAIPLFVWITGRREAVPEQAVSPVDRRLAIAKSRRLQFYRYGAIASTVLVLGAVGYVYARETLPKTVPPPEPVEREEDKAMFPLQQLEDGNLHRLGILIDGRMVRFLAMKTSDGKVRTALDACEICGTFGYIQEGESLLCLNCAAGINPLTLGAGGGCNPIPLESRVAAAQLFVPLAALREVAFMFTEQPALEEIDPVCGMRVRMNEAAAFETYAGKTYYFCNAMDGCVAEFRKNPAVYVK